jgi:U32 family peptidase
LARNEPNGSSNRLIRAYQDLLSGRSDAFELLDQVQALEKLGVTEGTLAEL